MNHDTIFAGTKLLKHLDRVAAWQRGETPAPVTMEFDLTGRCNHRCPACCGGYRCPDMPVDRARDWLSQMASYGVRGIMFTGGGEPLLHAACVDLVEHAASHGVECGFITNGSLLQQEHADRLVELCEWIRVSIDAADAETYRLTHGVGPDDFARAWAAVGLLAEARDRWSADCTIGVGYLLDDRTAGNMQVATVRARNLGADYLQFRPFHRDTFPIDPELFAACREEERGRFRVVCSSPKYAAIGKPREYTACHGAWFTGVVQADGQMPLCCHLRGRPEWYLGSLRSASFREVWESRRRAELLGRLDVAACLPGCRNDPLSVWLEAVRRPAAHEAFV